MKTTAKELGLGKGDSSSTSLRRANFASVSISFPAPSDLIRPTPSQKIKLPNKPICALRLRHAFLAAFHFVFTLRKTHRNKVKHTETNPNKVIQSKGVPLRILGSPVSHSKSTP